MNYTIDNMAKKKEENTRDDSKMAMSFKGLKLLIVGLLVMVAGYIMLTGGGSPDPQQFNYAMFDFRRLVAAPLLILCGIVLEVIAIMRAR